LGTIGARTGLVRDNYKITPGLYCLGTPGNNAPVLVTANYKLSFDTLRQACAGQDLWLLVIDTRGINVWCAAGKGTFSAEEIAYQVKKEQLEKLVTHRDLILPQLSANGVSARKLQKLCGFRGRFGPIQAADIPEYLKLGKCDEKMRSITFTLQERLVLIPVELWVILKKLVVVAVIIFLLSGISPAFFTPTQAFARGLILIAATGVAIFAGSVVTPICLPWLPFPQFWLKGFLTGTIAAVAFLFLLPQTTLIDCAAIFLFICGSSSFLAMTFTGSTPYTSLSGVSKEMRQGLVFQLGSILLAAIFWVIHSFI
jgi:hypothetical protein